MLSSVILWAYQKSCSMHGKNQCLIATYVLCFRLVNKRLSIPFGMLLAVLLNVAVRSVQKSIPTANVFTFYSAHFFLHAALPLLVLLYFPKPSTDPVANGAAPNARQATTRQSRTKYD